MVLSSFLVIAVKGAGSDILTTGAVTTRADPWNMLKPGTVITVPRNASFNNSYYFPISRGATVIDSRITISPQPLTAGGRDYLMNVSFNIGKGPREYGFSQWTNGYYTGNWGRQDRNISGITERTGMDLSTATAYKLLYVLPKNATIDHAFFNITGYQRAREFRNFSLESPFTSGGHFATSVQVVSDGTTYPLILIGAPNDNTERGAVQYAQYDGTNFVTGTFATGPTTFTQFGHALSETINIKSIGPVVAIGAPTEQIDKAGTVHLYDTSLNSELERFSGNDSSGSFGASIAVGNIDMDSDPELVVGAPTSLSGRGKVYIFDIVGSGGTFSEHTDLKTVLNGQVSDTDFGKAISIGDWNGDGREDLAIASDKEVRVIYGGTNMNADLVLDPLTDTGLSEIGTVVLMATSTTSAREDLYIGCPDTNGGKVAIYYGAATPDATMDKLINAPSGAKDFGTSISRFRDMNADGYNEVAIGAPGPLSSPGWVGIMDVRATAPMVLRNLPGIRNGDRFGAALVASSDLRIDGYNDIVVGAPEFKGSTTLGDGLLWLCEYFNIASLPVNTPLIRIGGDEVWRYAGDHLRESTITLDIASAIDKAVREKDVFMSTPTDQFVGVEIVIDSLASSNKEGSGTFDIFDYDIRYSYNVELDEDIAKAFNSYMLANPEAVQADGNYHVPIELSAVLPGKLSIFSFGIELDLVPSLKVPLKELFMDEDTTVDDLLDLRTVISDDRTSSVYLEFNATARGVNASKVAVKIIDGHWLSVRSPSKEQFRNWSGEVILTLTAVDAIGGRFISPDITLHVRSVNDAPGIFVLPPTLGKQDTIYRYSFEAVDAEMDPILYSVNGPENMTIDDTGVLTWTPSPWQVGPIGYELILGDGDSTRSYNFSVKVLNVNDPPYFVTPAPNITGVQLGETFTYQLRAIDTDPGDTISYALDGPFGAVLGSETGLLVWKPELFVSEPLLFEVRAFDQEGLKADLIFSLNILVEDDPPTLTSSPVRNLYDSRLWTYVIGVTDPNDDVVIIELESGPEGMEYDNWNNNLSWTPTAVQLGDFDVSLSIRSTIFRLFHNFTLTVSRSERAWELKLTSHGQGDVLKGKVRLGGIVSVSPGKVETVEFSMDQGEWVNCTLSQTEGYWTHDVDTRKVKDGKHIFYFRAFDGHGLSNELALEMTVKNREEPFPFLLVFGALLVVLVLIGSGVMLFLFIRKRNLEKIKEEQSKQQKEALTASRKEMDQFLTMTGHIDQGKDYTKMQVINLDSCERSKEIDAIFQPLNIQRECLDNEPVDLPEDILAKAKVSASVMEEDVAPESGMEPPAENPPAEDQQLP
jgi:hypothetical protein